MSSPQLVSVASGRHGGVGGNRPSPPRQDSAESQQGGAPPPSPVGGGLRHTTSSGTSTSVRSSAGANTLNFFRSVIGQRNNDYRSDVQVETPTAAGGANSNRAIYSARRAVLKRGSSQNSSGRAGQQQQQQNEGGGGGGAYQQGGGGLSCWQRIWYCACCCQGANFVCWQGRTELFSSMIHSRLWRMISIFFTLVLLFGAEFRFLVLPRRADPAMDGLFLTAFCFFCLDILMRMDCEANYFYFSLFCSQQRALRRQQRHHQQQQHHHGHHHHHHGGNNNVAAASTSAVGCGGCQFGSFLFYADVISTLTLLYEISFINKRYFATGTIHINLDAFGIPEGGLDAVNDPTPVEFTSELLVTIAKTARVARFIRSTTAVKISSKVNWYWFLNLLNPMWWFRTCCCCFKNRRAAAAAEQAAAAAAAANASAGMDPSNNNSSSLRAAHVLRRASWGGIITAAKLKRTKQQQLNAANNNNGGNNNNNNGNQKKSLWGLPMRILRYLGGRTEDEEWRQELAAAKIQRAWRTVLAAREKAAESTSQEQNNHNNVAWQDRGKQGAHVTASAAERAFRKRSFLSNYANTNNRGLRASSLGRKTTTAQGGGDASSPAGGGGGSVGDAGSNKDGSFSRRMMPGGGGGAAVAANKRTRQESRVGSAMRELTGQRVAIGIIVTLVLTVLFTYKENSATRPSTMIVLHNQTGNAFFADASLNAARSSSVPDLYRYQFADGQVRDFNLTNGEHQTGLRSREILNISVTGKDGQRTWGLFAYEREKKEEALVSLLSTIFILLVWFFGLTAFAGPVMILVVTPIERMVRLLGMLMLDPLGYQRTSRYKRFVAEEDEITKNTRWTKEVLKGMETSFLMSTILRIGSLMKVGFGSAGVEIIRNNLEKGQSKNMLILSSQGSTVSCIFLFCDIRQFTDATECLQEEVFVFTNRIAGVVHSICHSRGGSANKNIGDAFLVSWLLDEDESGGRGGGGGDFCAKNHQADKAMLTVVEISIALQHDEYYIETMSSHAREALLAKLSKRKGPVVQMGFGLHAGKAVQGAIGSQRKIDATYVSEEVEKAEFLESSTKKYGVKMLMSDSFHRLLHPSNRCRCRKVDQIVLADDDDNDDDDDEDYMSGDIMELLTFDMDIEALWRKSPSTPKGAGAAGATSGGGDGTETAGGGDASEKAGGGGGVLPDQKKSSSKRNLYDRASAGGPPAHAAAAAAVAAKRTALNKGKRMSISMSMRGNKDKENKEFNTSDELSDGAFVAGAAGGTAAAGAGGATAAGGDGGDKGAAGGAGAAGGGGGGGGAAGAGGDDGPPELKLPTGPVMYESRVWVEGNMRKIRQLYSDGLFFRKFNTGLQAFYGKDWDEAKACFAGILERFEDGPSRYFMNQIEHHGGKPPRDFRGYGKG